MDKDTTQAILEAIHAQGEQLKVMSGQIDDLKEIVKSMDSRLQVGHELLQNVERIVQGKEHYRLSWQGNVLALMTGFASFGAFIFNQIFFRLFP